MTQDLANLIAIRSGLIATLAAETAAQLSGGAKPHYVLDGETYEWTEWRTAMTAMIEQYNALIQRESGPYIVVSRQRS